MSKPEVLIVGAGLAGLSCALHLQRRGMAVKVFEAGEVVGGRVRTDEIDGYRLDRGFQVLLTAYPEARQMLDYDALELGLFYPGALTWIGDRFHRVADPVRYPIDAFGTLFSPLGSIGDKVRVLKLRQALLAESLDGIFRHSESTTEAALSERWGFGSRIVESFFRPFLGGILLDRSLEADARIAEFVFRMFTEGYAALPAGGMGAIPHQLAGRLAEHTVKLNARVVEVQPRSVRLENGQTYEADAVVVATEAPEAAALLPIVPPSASCATACLYFAADEAPISEPVLVLDGNGEGPANHLAVPSNVARGYAPEGRALVSASVVGNPLMGDLDLEAAVRRQLTVWFGNVVGTWKLLRVYRVLYALPEQSPPFLRVLERTARLEPGLYVCGDHRTFGSQQGALRSGRLAAEAVEADLAAASK